VSVDEALNQLKTVDIRVFWRRGFLKESCVLVLGDWPDFATSANPQEDFCATEETLIILAIRVCPVLVKSEYHCWRGQLYEGS